MVSGEKSYTKGGNMRAPSLDVLCGFMVKAWEQVTEDSVIKSFKKCGLSNSMDEMEDDLLWQDSEDDDEPLLSDVVFDPCDDVLSQEECDQLIPMSDSENDFEGFE
ncbi:hypothetical protein Pcinc_003488 [Petrolisthes cinctipes]|uniref:DDE-1 domain-containing protein n=1 Tax=Petrolisthes cinctipes TaxID=88211 RepID=A0AAE1GIY6_PETCI|nr:hypothetical protein Pcinc_003488 [Petrolisthes cinctipes]